jgi:hypothetical protein
LIAITVFLKDQIAFLQRLLQGIPLDIWHCTEKEVKLPDGINAWDEAMLRPTLPVDKGAQKFCKLCHTQSDNQLLRSQAQKSKQCFTGGRHLAGNDIVLRAALSLRCDVAGV